MQTTVSNRKNTIILFFTMVVVLLGFGIIIPILPFYVESFNAHGLELGLLMATYATMQFLFSPLWGDLSDRYGRKPFLIIGALGNGLAMMLMGLATQLWMLFAARILAGILAAATLPTAMAYIGDSTSPEDRGRGMGLIGAAMGVGMVIGPGLGGTLAGISLSAPFYLSAGVSTLAAVIILIALPESLPKSRRNRLENSGFRGPQVRKMWEALFSPIGILLVLAFLLSFGLTNFESVFGLFALEKFGYSAQRVGLILTAVGITSALVQGLLTGPFIKRWGDIRVIRAAMLGTAAGFLLMLLAEDFPSILFTTSLFVFSNSLLRPSVSSLTSKWSQDRQGMAMGLNNSFMSLGRIFGPVWAGMVFDIRIFMPYISGSVIMTIGFLVSLLWLKEKNPIQIKSTKAHSTN